VLAKDIRPNMLVKHPKMPGYHPVDLVKHTTRIDHDGTETLLGVHLSSREQGTLHEVGPTFEIDTLIAARPSYPALPED
jgi:hypothetical protein